MIGAEHAVTAGIAAALHDSGLLKFSSQQEFDDCVLAASSSRGKTAAAVPADPYKVEALKAVFDKLTENGTLIPGMALGVLAGGYLGRESKWNHDHLGVPYNSEYEF